MIEIEIKDTILIDEEDIVSFEQLTKNSTDKEIRDGVHDFVLGMDDSDYFYAKQHEEEIYKKVKKFLENT